MIRPADQTTPLPTPAAESHGELVVLTHGIASNRFMLFPLATRLRRAGFATRLYGYPSMWWSNRKYGTRLATYLRRIAPKYDRVHLVVHSMGGIVARCAFTEELPDNLGRVVQIAPPNQGSHAATRLTVDSTDTTWAATAWNQLVVRPHRLLSPTLRELTDLPDSFVNQLGPAPAGIDIGVLAASNDRVLYPEQTHLEGEADYHIVQGWHTSVLWTQETAQQTAQFLKTGRFSVS